MRKSTFLMVFVFLTAFMAAPAAFAGSVDLTTNGSNTTITIAGTYASGVPSFGGIAAPNANYTITFTLPTNPNSLSSFVSFTGVGGGFDVDTSLTFDVNNVSTSFNNITMSFFDTLNGDLGGLVFCLDASCNTEWNLFGGPLFDNNNTNPTLLSGPISIDQVNSGYFVNGSGSFPFGVAPTPEPSSLLLLGTGLVGLAAWGRRKFFA